MPAKPFVWLVIVLAPAGLRAGEADPVQALAELGASYSPNDGTVDASSRHNPDKRITDKTLAQMVPHLARLPKLSRLDLSGSAVTEGGLKRLAALKRLPELDLGGTNVGDVAAGAIAAIPGLERLGLKQTFLTDAGLMALATASGLRHLDLEATGVTADGLQALAGLELESLVLPAEARTEAGLRHLLRLAPGATALDLGGWKLTDAALPLIAARKSLEDLDLGRTGVTTIEPLAGLGRLRHLRLAGLPRGDELAAVASGFGELETLHLGRTGLTDAGLAKLAGLKRLGYLHLEATAVTDQGIASLANLGGLAGLNLEGTKVTGKGLASLPKKPFLYIMLPETARDDEGFRRWLDRAASPQVTGLTLNGWAITDDALDALELVPNLTSIELRRTGVTDAGLPKLARLKALRSVELVGTGVTPEGAAALRGLIPGIRVLLEAPKSPLPREGVRP